MKFYNLDTVFTFGKFDGKTVREVLDIEHSYIDWCAINLEHFYISGELIEEIKSIIPSFLISEEGRNKLFEKYEFWEIEQEYYNEHENSDNYDNFPSAYDNPYYNEDLDMDQQSGDFWDSL